MYGSNDNINYKLIKDFNYGTELDASFDLGRIYSYNYFKILLAYSLGLIPNFCLNRLEK